MIPASFLCGIIAAVFIWRGGQKTKRTKQVAERLRHALTMGQHNFEMTPDEAHLVNGMEKVDGAGTNPSAIAKS